MLDILKSLSERPAESRWGIGTAAVYLRQVEPFLKSTNLSAFKAFDLGSDDEWSKIVEEAAKTLTWCDEGMLIKGLNEPTVGEEKQFILTFDAILSSNRKDRDGDILSTKGLEIDPNSSLLWHHIPLQPYGKLLSVVEKTDSFVKCRYGIVDTVLGRDAATLTKGGCLRMSHGFRAKEFEPLAFATNAKGDKIFDKEGNPIVKGWHIKSAETFESSQVSIPANSDAVIMTWEKGGFRSVLVKGYAKSLFDSRPKQAPGVDFAALAIKGAQDAVGVALKSVLNIPADQILAADQIKAGRRLSAASRERLQGILTTLQDFMGEDDPDDKTDGGRQGANPEVTGEANPNITTGVASSGLSLFRKDFSPEAFKSLYGAMESMEMPGSAEWFQEQLNRQAKSYLIEKGKIARSEDTWTDVIATYPDHVYICSRKWASGQGYDSRTVYKVSWEATEKTKGRATLIGEPSEVELRVGVVEKAIEKSLDSLASADLVRGVAARLVVGSVPPEVAKSLREALDLSGEHELAAAFMK